MFYDKIENYQMENTELNFQLPEFNSNIVSISTNINNSEHGELSQIIQDFNKMNKNEIISSMLSSNQITNKTILFENNFGVIADKIIKDIINKCYNEKQEILDYLDKQNITPQEIYNWLLHNQDNSNYEVLLGEFYYSGIGTDANWQKAFELFQTYGHINLNGKSIS